MNTFLDFCQIVGVLRVAFAVFGAIGWFICEAWERLHG